MIEESIGKGTIKPVFVLGKRAGVFVTEPGRMEIVPDAEAVRTRLKGLRGDLERELGDLATVRDALTVSTPSAFDALFSSKETFDLLLVYILGITPLEGLLGWEGPMVVFSGNRTPAMALYAVGEERHHRKNLSVALDYQDIRRALRVLHARKQLSASRVALIGSPPSWHLRWYGFPDLEAVRRKAGVQFIPLSLQDLVEAMGKGLPEEAAATARAWVLEARDVSGPSEDMLHRSATLYLALDALLRRAGATAMTVNCQEMIHSPRFSGGRTNPCMGMSLLRDRGIPAGCEMDIAGLLSMMLLGFLARKPAFMGNLVYGDPGAGILRLSHCILPAKMPGFTACPLPYSLRDYHGGPGVTSFTNVPPGTRVTVARVQRNLERLVAFPGEVLACEDTVSCRNTLTLRVPHVREILRQTEGNHQALVFGDCLEELEALCKDLDCGFFCIRGPQGHSEGT